LAQTPKRILITISFSFSIRYIVRTGLLERIKQYATPVVVLTWHQPDLIGELQAANIEVHVLPPTGEQPEYENTRRKINYWFNHLRVPYASKSIQEQYLRLYYPARHYYAGKLIAWYNILKFYTPGYTAVLFKEEAALLHANPAFAQMKDWVSALAVDSVFTLTPFHRQEDVLLRACKACGLQMLTSILSFDNITKRGWIPVEYDVYMVWNRYNQEELQAIYPFTKNKPVHITGAPQFDFYNNKGWLFTPAEWQQMAGITALNGRKIILYAGGPKALFPQEPLYLKHIDEAINDNKIKGNPVVLFRCHPVDDVARWKEAVRNTSNIIFETSWTGKEKLHLANITNNDIKKLCSTLAYTDVHVNVCSTIALDGSMFNKPQIGPAYLDTRRAGKLLKNMYFQKHFQPVIEGNGIALADSREMLIEQINEALASPEKFTGNQTNVLKEIITYTDSSSTARVAAVIEDALYSTVHQSTPAQLCLQQY
jgi:hypothetical protein